MNAERSCPPGTADSPPAELTRTVLGAFFEVHWELGHGFLEIVYVRALHAVLADAGLRVEREARLPVRFRDRVIGCFRADLLIEGLLILEIKAVRQIERAHVAQVLNYLRASDVEVALLLNFGLRPTFRRLVFGNARKSPLRSSAYICGSSPERYRLAAARLDAPGPPSPR